MRVRNASHEVPNHGNEDDASEHGHDEDNNAEHGHDDDNDAEHGHEHDATGRGNKEVAVLRCARRLRLP